MAAVAARRQRENALLYVRGLIEHGGRKSLQPTLFRLEETPARYESMQQFLADSPWDPELLVRGCAERVAPEIGVVAWVVDDTGIVKDGKHSPGVKRQYSGTLGKIGNCQITVSVHAVGRARHGTAGLAALPARGVVRRLGSGGGRRRSPRRSASRPSRSSPSESVPAGGRLGDAGGADPCRRAYGDDTAFRTGLHDAGLEYVLAVRGGDERLRAGDDLRGARAATVRSAGRGRSPAPTASPSRVRALASGCRRKRWQTLPCRTTPAGDDVCSRFAFVRVVATHPVRNDHLPPRVGVADHRMARRAEAPSDYWLSNLPAGRAARAARPARPAALDDRARLPPAQGRARTRPLRRPQLPRLPPPHALVTCAHAFLTLERLDPKAPRPA